MDWNMESRGWKESKVRLVSCRGKDGDTMNSDREDRNGSAEEKGR